MPSTQDRLTKGGSHAGRAAVWLPWLCVAAIPLLFALATWAGMPSTSVFVWAQRIFGLPVIAAELLFVLFAISKGATPLGFLLSQKPWVKAALFALLAICIADAATVSPRPLFAIGWSLITVIHLLFGVTVAQLSGKLNGRERLRVWRAILAGACSYVGLLAIFYFSQEDPTRFDWEHLKLGTNNIRHTGHYAVVGACAALGLAMCDRGSSKPLYLAAAGICTALAFWSGTRGALIAIWGGLALICLAIPAWRSWRPIVELVGVTAASSALAFILPAPHLLLGIGRMGSSFQGGDLNTVSSFRIGLWESASRLIGERPLFGYGPGQFWWLLPENPYDVMHPHNIVLQSLLQWGVVGTGLFLALAAYIFRGLWHRRRVFEASDGPAAVTVAALAVMSIYDGSLLFVYPTALFAFSLGWLSASRAT